MSTQRPRSKSILVVEEKKDDSDTKKMDEIVKKVRKMEKKKDKAEFRKMIRESTTKERKRMDQLSQTRKSVEKYLRMPSKQNKIMIKNMIERNKISPPASGFKYQFLEPKEIFEQGIKEKDDYMIKNAMRKGLVIDLDTLPDKETFLIWYNIYQPKDKKEKDRKREQIENLKTQIEEKIAEKDMDDEDEHEEISEFMDYVFQVVERL